MEKIELSIEIPDNILPDAIRQALFKGELGAMVADKLANLYAEVTTYNRTAAAKLLNIARSTLHSYESEGVITFRADGRISLAALLEFQRSLAARKAEESDGDEKTANRKSHKPKRRSFK